MAKALDILRSFGIRPSSQRLTVLSYLLDHREHNTAEEVLAGLQKEMPMLSRTTVYNTLRLFKETGVVQTLTVGSGIMRFDAQTAPHAHLFCNDCHAIVDIPVEEPDWQRMRLYAGSDEAEMQVIFRGRCRRCRQKDNG